MVLPKRIFRALTRLIRRHRGRIRKKYLTGPPSSFLFAASRQVSAENYFAAEFEAQLKHLPSVPSFFRTVESAFVHVPKCGGTSMHYWLREELGLAKLNSPDRLAQAMDRTPRPQHVSFGHLDVDSLIERGFLKPAAIENTFVYSLVRNPYTRALSLFAHFRQIGQLPPSWTLNSFLRLVQESKPSNGLFNLARLSQAAPQADWVRQQRWKGPDLVVKIERVKDLVVALQGRLGLSSEIPHERKSAAVRFRDQWDSNSARLVQEIYWSDFEAFNYSPEELPFGHV